ncbi:MAG: hypothetical protein ACOVQM_03600 [Pirellula sp.]
MNGISLNLDAHLSESMRMLTVIDEFTRECLCIRVAHQLKSEDVLEVLAELFLSHGLPDGTQKRTGTTIDGRGGFGKFCGLI